MVRRKINNHYAINQWIFIKQAFTRRAGLFFNIPANGDLMGKF